MQKTSVVHDEGGHTVDTVTDKLRQLHYHFWYVCDFIRVGNEWKAVYIFNIHNFVAVVSIRSCSHMVGLLQ